VSVTALSLSPAKAQDCSFPLAWPFCVAGAAVYTAGAIATAPFRPYYYYGSPYYYYAPAYYGPRYRYRHRHHYRRYY
jgi:hypothetical protein